VAAKVEAKPEPKAEAKAESKSEARFAVASAVSLPVRFNSGRAQTEPATAKPEAAAAAPTGILAGSTEPIRPVLVKTLSVKAGTQTASLAPLHVPPPAAAEPAPVRAAAPVAPPAPPAPVVAVKAEPPAPQPAPVLVVAAKPEPTPAPSAPPVAAKTEEPLPALVTANKPEVPALSFAPIAAKAEPSAPAASAPAPAAKPQHRSGWMIQVGAYPGEQAAKQRLTAVQSKAAKMLTRAEAFTETVEKGGTTYYRARFAGLDKDSAEAACKYLKRNDVECVTIKN
jgi:D-alanyl-D-alanine carboxypeptidase